MFFRLLLSFVLLIGLLSAQENNGDKTIKSALEHYLIDTTLIEILSDISKEYDTFLDIAPIPIFDELTDLDNENVDKVLESISEFNDLINKAQNTLGSVEQSVKSSKDYDTCETDIGLTECTYFRDKGDYSITVKQEITPHWYTYAVYCSGVFAGVDYGSMYLLQDQLMFKNGKRFNLQFYRPPSPPECANERLFTIDKYIFDDGTTIYTPWGTSSNQEIVFKSTRYHCLPVLGKKDSHPYNCHEMSIKGNTLIMKHSTWSYKNEQLYPRWVGILDRESHTGTWMSFDEDGILQETGPM